MDLSILGPVRVNGVPLPGRKRAALLAVLLLDAGRFVPITRIVDALWDADPPATARQQAQNLTARLRRELAGAGVDAAIEAVTDGYRLTVDEARFDLTAFTAGTARARALAASGRAEEAVEAYAEALSLWRGDALSGLTGPVFDAAAARLTELRMTAVAERVELELGLGRGGRLVGELQELARAHPYRQPLTGQLMRALHDGGRTTEALDVYRDLRVRLADELGIDPDAGLVRLHRELLAGGAEPEPESTAGPAVTVPAQLPALVGGFTGREETLCELDKAAASDAPGVRLVCLSGTAGVGKTALAVHWAHAHRADFPDGQLFVNLRGYDHGEQMGAGEALARFLRAFGVEELPADTDERAALWRTVVAERRVLVVLDNAGTAEQVRPLLPGGPHSLTLVTSRDRMFSLVATHGARQLTADVLSTGDSLDLLAGMLGAERTAAEPAAAERLAGLCGRLPLALRIAAASLVLDPHLGIGAYAERLESADRLSLLAVDGDEGATVAGAFDLSYRALTPEARDVFHRIGLIPGEDFHEDLAVAVSGRGEGETRRLLGALVAANLLERHRAERYRGHDLIRLYAKGKAYAELGEGTRGEVVEAMLEWFADPQARNKDEFTGRVAMIREYRDAPRLWRATRTFMTLVVHGHDPEVTYECLALVRATAEREGDLFGLAQLEHTTGAVLWEAGDYARAAEYGERAVELAERSGDRFLLGRCLGSVGLSYYARDELPKAIELLSRAVEAPVEEWATHSRIIRLTNLGNAYLVSGRLAEAQKCFDSAAELIDLATGRADLHTLLSYAFARLAVVRGEYDAAEKHLSIGIEKSDEAGAYRYRALLRSVRGQLLLKKGRPREAGEAYREAIRIALDNHRKDLIRDLRIGMARAFVRQGASDQALEVLDGMRDNGTANDSYLSDARCEVYTAIGRHTEAVRSGEQAVSISAGYGRHIDVARALLTLGDAYAGLGDMSSAGGQWRSALDIAEPMGIAETRDLKARLDAHALTQAAHTPEPR